MIMIHFYKNFKFLFLFIILCLVFLKDNKSSANYIRDTELEFALYNWSKPIFKAANINPEQIKIHIIQDRKINAFVIDGKNMFLNTGLITNAGSASGVIGVIAHEAGHISAGHILKLKEKIKTLSNNQFFTSLLGLGVLLAGAKSQTISRRIQQK